MLNVAYLSLGKDGDPQESRFFFLRQYFVTLYKTWKTTKIWSCLVHSVDLYTEAICLHKRAPYTHKYARMPIDYAKSI